MNPGLHAYRGSLLHFVGDPGDGAEKFFALEMFSDDRAIGVTYVTGECVWNILTHSA